MIRRTDDEMMGPLASGFWNAGVKLGRNSPFHLGGEWWIS